MPAFIDLAGHRYGRWTVIREMGRKFGGATWLCRCDCGSEKVVRGMALRGGDSRSCGCLMRETAAALGKASATHGKSHSKAWDTWTNIRQRCENPNSTPYPKYGGRGIKVCERWQKFENFYADMGDPPSKAHTLDRIDPSGNYEPGNCRWATQLEQQNNRRSNRLITAFGKTKTLQQWARETGFAHRTIHNRIANLGWSPEVALTLKPVLGRNQSSA